MDLSIGIYFLAAVIAAGVSYTVWPKDHRPPQPSSLKKASLSRLDGRRFQPGLLNRLVGGPSSGSQSKSPMWQICPANKAEAITTFTTTIVKEIPKDILYPSKIVTLG